MLRWAQSRFSHGFAATKILAKGYQIIFLFLQTVSPYQQKIWLDFCLHKVRFPRLNHDILPGCRGQGGVTDRPGPALSLLSPCKQKLTTSSSFPANGSFQWAMKGFITFFQIWIFVIAYAWLLFFCVLTVMKTNLTSCESKFAPWLGNALFWFADQTVSKLEKLWTGYSTTNSKLKYITQFSWKNHP